MVAAYIIYYLHNQIQTPFKTTSAPRRSKFEYTFAIYELFQVHRKAPIAEQILALRDQFS